MSEKPGQDGAGAPVGPYPLPALRFGYDALAPVISEEALRLHHEKHHRAYVDGVNAALSRHPEWLGRTIEDVLRHLPEVPEDIRETVRRQGGGHANHQFFWKVLTEAPGGNAPQGEFATAIDRDFGSFEAFKTTFETAGMQHFGSGWAFLVAKPRQNFKLEILTLANQDSVLCLPEPSPGLLICDLWEHAYYVDYQNRRADWLKTWWRLVDWPYIGERYAGVLAGRKHL